MQLPSVASFCRHTTLQVATSRPTEFIDLTNRLERIVADADVHTGILSVQTLHTTTAVLVNEHKRLLLHDFQALLNRIAPEDGRYHHDNAAARGDVPLDERRNGHAHCRALLLPSSASFHIAGGRLILGRWQRVFLLELDGPRQREVSALVLGEARP